MTYIGFAGAFMGFVSAALWFWSTVASVEVDPNDRGYKVSSEIRGRKIDFHRTLELQTKINRWAAGATGAASLFAAITLLLAPGAA